MANDNKGIWPVALAVIAVIILSQIFVVISINSNTNEAVDKPVNIDLTSVENAINDLGKKIDAQVTDNDKIDYIYEKESKRDVIEAKALEIATAYVNSKDFKKLFEDTYELQDTDGNESTPKVDVCIAIKYNDEKCLGIESYKDITQIKVIESEFNRKTDTVTFEIKVYFNVDGDDEEKAYVVLKGLVVSIEDLEYDDQFEDAEVTELSGAEVSDSIVKVKYFD